MTADSPPVDIAALRRRLGEPGKPVSQAGLAALLGVNQATVSRMEADPSKQKGPAAVLLRKLDVEAPREDQAA